jgi:tetratricopeptide (TPR) repeat protein
MKPGRNDPCLCGSGRKYKKCCGRQSELRPEPARAQPTTLSPIETNKILALARSGHHSQLEGAARELLTEHPDSGFLWKALGLSLLNQGKDPVHAWQTAARLLPEDADVHNNLGSALRDRGRIDAAVASYRRAVEIKPHSILAHNNLGNCLRDLGEHAAAAASYRVSLAADPEQFDVYIHLGHVLLELGEADAAAESYRRALMINPENAVVHANLAMALKLQDRLADAEASCRRALEINPALAAPLALLGQIHAEKNDFIEAENLIRRAISIDPNMPEALVGLVRLRKMTPGDAYWLAAAERIVAGQLPPRKEARLRYALGKYFDDVKDFGRAFANYQRANELMRRINGIHDQQALTRRVERIIELYDSKWLSNAVQRTDGSERLIFIVGMWRSGRTLAEQILASHPAVVGLGELPFWSTVGIAHEQSFVGGNSGTVRKLAGEYLAAIGDRARNAARVVDKMASNFMHLGLIHAALPNARFIHMRRHPIDTCLSIHFQDFRDAHLYAYDLEDLAHYYAHYTRVMEHWRRTLPRDAILDVSYEELVEKQAACSRRIVDYVGLEWDDRCLSFHLTDRTVRTVSKWQVRQPMNRSSVDRWRNYEKFIAPLHSLASLKTE